jgi:hypothetical protein
MIGSAEKSSFVFTSISQSYCIKLDPYELGRNHLLVMIDSLASSLMSATYYSFRAAAIRYLLLMHMNPSSNIGHGVLGKIAIMQLVPQPLRDLLRYYSVDTPIRNLGRDSWRKPRKNLGTFLIVVCWNLLNS